MQRLFSRFTVLTFVFALCVGAVFGGIAVAATQVHMHNAKTDLQSALDQLNIATPDKGGHRANAIDLVNQAIKQVDLGISAAE